MEELMSRQLLRFVPHTVRQGLRRYLHARAIKAGRFGDVADPFFERMSELVHEGDWVIDVGAAVGDYTIRLSELVGANGRVVALEPMAVQFDLLTSNACHAAHANITCLQLAVGERTEVSGMEAPVVEGSRDWYLSRVSADGNTRVLVVPLDGLCLPDRVTLIKIDTEGQDMAVLRGAVNLIERDRPAILIEDDEPEVQEWLSSRNFHRHADAGSANKLYLAR
jgi:FkbM family methyltransferase